MTTRLITGKRLLFYYMGVFVSMIGGIMLLPLLILPFYPSEISDAKYFILPGIVTVLLGYLFQMYDRATTKGTLAKHQDATLVVLIWIVAIFCSSFPFLLTGKYTWIESLFEVTSGYSTTGLSVVDVTTTGHLFLFYRTILLFFGGVGFVLVITSAISDKMGMRLYFAEGHNDKLMPNLIKSARMILSIYALYITFGTIGYIVFGMPWFDALNHAIASVSTGGFSTKADSIGHYQSYAIENITIILMLLGSTNFLIHLKLLTGKWRILLKHTEFRFALGFLLILLPIMIGFVWNHQSSTLFEAFRMVTFQTVSALTTTGFQTIPNFTTAVPQSFITGVIICMIIGGGFGSTAGGMKQYRVALSLKASYWTLQSQMMQKNLIKPHFIDKYGQKVLITDKMIADNYAFLMIYLITLLVGTLVIQSYGYPFQDALFEFASSLSTVGLSTGIIGKGTPALILLTSMLGMFLGRLEFYVVYIAIAQMFK